MTEQEAREAIIAWAKEHFAGVTQPQVEVEGIHYDAEFDVWDAKLSVSTSVDDPYMTFTEDSMYKHGVYVNAVEY
jgi:hypothetical protein